MNMIYIKNLIAFFLIAISSIYIISCSYSFTGASVPSHLNSIAIPIASDRSGSGEPDLNDDFTNMLIQKFIDDNTLLVADKVNADALLECTITSMNDAPAVVGTGVEGENISRRKITISVKILYRDLVKKTTLLEESYSNYGEYSTDDDIITARQAAIEEAVKKLTEDILLAVVSNW
ncbi:MAG: LPS assembly lipoprotein LptE [bacterium]